MIARLLISPLFDKRVEEINKILSLEELTPNHPDLLYLPYTSKLGIVEARKIKDFFSLKPYSAKGRVVVLEDASALTDEAQNALLKTLEELPKNGLFILAADYDAKLLPTVLSRCEVIRLSSEEYNNYNYNKNYIKDLEALLKADIPQRFEYIEKLKDREEFLKSLVLYFHQNLPSHMENGNVFLKDLLKAEEWAKQNVNIRAILEYLMLVMPSDRSKK